MRYFIGILVLICVFSSMGLSAESPDPVPRSDIEKFVASEGAFKGMGVVGIRVSELYLGINGYYDVVVGVVGKPDGFIAVVRKTGQGVMLEEKFTAIDGVAIIGEGIPEEGVVKLKAEIAGIMKEATVISLKRLEEAVSLDGEGFPAGNVSCRLVNRQGNAYIAYFNYSDIGEISVDFCGLWRRVLIH